MKVDQQTQLMASTHEVPELQAPEQSLWRSGGKRAFDLLVMVPLGLLAIPVLLVCGLLIKLSDHGPVFFIQERAGKNGRPFRAWKLRTMRAGRRPDPREIVPLHHAEITTVGRWLRRFKLDELPQLWNVLMGDMSLVGPRPTLLDQAAAYDDFRRQRLLVRPGLTGLAQVHGNAGVPWDERILFDIAYVRRCGPGLDLLILLRTVAVVFLGEARMTRPFKSTRFAGIVTPPPGYGVSAGG